MTLPLDPPRGALWRKIDLHAHSPGVPSFRLPGGSNITTDAGKERIADLYVGRLVDAKIEIACITDYQGVREDWFRLINERAESAGVTVLPGAEMSIARGAGKGVHLLLICDADTEPNKINDALRYEDRDGSPLFEGRAAHRDINLRDDLGDTLERLREKLGCVVIAAHASGDNGVLRRLGPAQTADLVKNRLLDAVDNCEGVATRLQGTGELTEEQLSNLACTVSSDAKSLDEIGSRATWIKLSTVTADAIRLALHDPRTRVTTAQPAPPVTARILRLDVDGPGFLGDIEINWNDDLNVLIGGRGAGKSAILESLRYALNGRPFVDVAERESLVQFALGSGGRARVIIERPGPARPQQYEITRIRGQLPRVTDLESGGVIDVEPLELFGPRAAPVFLLQREIQAISRDESFRLRLLDELIGEDAKQAMREVRRTVDRLKTNARQLDRLEEQLAQLDESRERLSRIQAEIEFFERQGVAEKLRRHSLITADGAVLEDIEMQVVQLRDDWTNAVTTTVEQLRTHNTRALQAESDRADILIELATELRNIADDVERLGTRGRGLLDRGFARIRAARQQWREVVEPLEDELRQIQEQLNADQLDPGRLIEAVRERTALTALLASLTKLQERRHDLQTERAELLRVLQDHRRDEYTLRRRAAGTVNLRLGGKLILDVEYLGDKEEYRQQISALLRGSRIGADTINRIVEPEATDGIQLAQAIRKGVASVSAEFNLTHASAERLVQWLSPTERQHELELLAPQDRVTILLDVNGERWPLERLSSGQRATAMLLLLFAQEGRTLVLDQPEDDLDNRFVYEDVVPLLRDEKGVRDPSKRRQLIIATHNANIPVNGDAELVMSLSGEDGRCRILSRASIDDQRVRSQIRTILEGGAEAFRRRAEKYGGLDDT